MASFNAGKRSWGIYFKLPEKLTALANAVKQTSTDIKRNIVLDCFARLAKTRFERLRYLIVR
ncbi:MAG: hypothetical protein HYX60_08765 [Legionella longbeachae]|nr:hypothetical protein [Legionella longbeachae]